MCSHYPGTSDPAEPTAVGSGNDDLSDEQRVEPGGAGVLAMDAERTGNGAEEKNRDGEQSADGDGDGEESVDEEEDGEDGGEATDGDGMSTTRSNGMLQGSEIFRQHTH